MTHRIHIPADLPVTYSPGWLDPTRADDLMATLTDQLPWVQHSITIFGRTSPTPRLTCWIASADYSYGGNVQAAHAWSDMPPALNRLRRHLEDELGAPFDSVLGNLYRDGGDTVGWHADDEAGTGPTIASISLGAERDFAFRRKADRTGRTAIPMAHGSLVVMTDDCQDRWEHSVPRRKRITEPRLNLTFRNFRP